MKPNTLEDLHSHLAAQGDPNAWYSLFESRIISLLNDLYNSGKSEEEAQNVVRQFCTKTFREYLKAQPDTPLRWFDLKISKITKSNATPEKDASANKIYKIDLSKFSNDILKNLHRERSKAKQKFKQHHNSKIRSPILIVLVTFFLMALGILGYCLFTNSTLTVTLNSKSGSKSISLPTVSWQSVENTVPIEALTEPSNLQDTVIGSITPMVIDTPKVLLPENHKKISNEVSKPKPVKKDTAYSNAVQKNLEKKITGNSSAQENKKPDPLTIDESPTESDISNSSKQLQIEQPSDTIY